MICAIIKGCYPYFINSGILRDCLANQGRALESSGDHRTRLFRRASVAGDFATHRRGREMGNFTPLSAAGRSAVIRVDGIRTPSSLPAISFPHSGMVSVECRLPRAGHPVFRWNGAVTEKLLFQTKTRGTRGDRSGGSGDSSELRRTCNGSGSRSSTDLSFAPAPVVWSEFPAVAFFAGGRSEPSPFCDTPDFWILRPNEPEPPARKLLEMNANGFCYILYQAVGTHRNPPEYEHDLRRNLSTLSAGI